MKHLKDTITHIAFELNSKAINRIRNAQKKGFFVLEEVPGVVIRESLIRQGIKWSFSRRRKRKRNLIQESITAKYNNQIYHSEKPDHLLLVSAEYFSEEELRVLLYIQKVSIRHFNNLKNPEVFTAMVKFDQNELVELYHKTQL